MDQLNIFESPSHPKKIHDAFVQMESIAIAEFDNLTIYYNFEKSPFGDIIIASTKKGVCYLAFYDNEEKAIEDMKVRYPKADIHQKTDIFQENALAIFQSKQNSPKEIKLHVKGTDFQLKIWKKLLEIPMGSLSTYSSIAQQIDQPQAIRAVGTAVGANPVAFIIPCHRVRRSSGGMGGYMWGIDRKKAIIAWESTFPEI